MHTDDTLSESSYTTATSSSSSTSLCKCCNMATNPPDHNHRYCRACFLRFRVRKYGWNPKEKEAMAKIASYLRRRELQRQCHLQYTSLLRYYALKEARRDFKFTSTASTNTDPAPTVYNPLDIGPRPTLESMQQRQTSTEHELGWLREYAIRSIANMADRLRALECARNPY